MTAKACLEWKGDHAYCPYCGPASDDDERDSERECYSCGVIDSNGTGRADLDDVWLCKECMVKHNNYMRETKVPW